MTNDEIINKVTNSGLVTLNLEDFRPVGERIGFDLKQNLFMNQILREKEFREFLKNHEWTVYQDKHVHIFCSEDVIIPTWAYMLLTTKLQAYASTIVMGSEQDLETKLYSQELEKIDLENYKNARVVVKGCSKEAVPTPVYVEITKILQPIALSIMFGEPCSTVPVFKRK